VLKLLAVALLDTDAAQGGAYFLAQLYDLVFS
jgi:hypothetical protein